MSPLTVPTPDVQLPTQYRPWAGSQHRPKAERQGERASLRDVRTEKGSRRSRGLAGRVRRAPRRRHLSPTARAADWPRAAGPRAGGATRNARPGRSPSRLKAPLIMPQRESAARGQMRQRSSPEGPRPLRGSVKPRVREASAKTGPQRMGRNRARSRPKVGRRRFLRSMA